MIAEHPHRRPVVVTGASAGIGAATARVFAAAGYPVALGARRVAACEQIVAEIRAAGGEAVAAPLDVSSTPSVHDFAEFVTAELGGIEIVVSNAGVVGLGAVHEVDPVDFAAVLEVNLMGTQRVMQAFVPGMVARQRGDFVIISSEVVQLPRPFTGGYGSSKGGVEGLADSAILELEGTGVRASVVRPGFTNSEAGAHWDPDQAARSLSKWERYGLARHVDALAAQSVGEAALWIASSPRGVHLTAVDIRPEFAIATGEEQP